MYILRELSYILIDIHTSACVQDTGLGLFCKMKIKIRCSRLIESFSQPVSRYNDSLLVYIVKPVIIIAASRLIFSKRSAFIRPQLSYTSQEYSKIGRINVNYILSTYSRSSLNLSFLRTFNCFDAFSIILLIWIVHLQSEINIRPSVYVINLDIIKIKIRVKVAVSNTEYHYICFIWISLTSHCSDHFDTQVYIRQVD